MSYLDLTKTQGYYTMLTDRDAAEAGFALDARLFLNCNVTNISFVNDGDDDSRRDEEENDGEWPMQCGGYTSYIVKNEGRRSAELLNCIDSYPNQKGFQYPPFCDGECWADMRKPVFQARPVLTLHNHSKLEFQSNAGLCLMSWLMSHELMIMASSLRSSAD